MIPLLSIRSSVMDPQKRMHQLLAEDYHRLKQRNSGFSLRAYSRRIGIPSSALSEILSGKRKVTRRVAEKILSKLAIDPLEARKLTTQIPIIHHKKAKSTPKNPGKDFVELPMDQYLTISEWYYFAILSLSEVEEFDGTPEWISARLGIRKNDAASAIERLIRLKLLERDDKGKVKSTGEQLTTGDIPSAAYVRAHSQNLDLAQRSLDTDPSDLKDFSSMTMTIDPKKIGLARERILQFRREICAFMESSGPKLEVYRMNVQLYPLSKPMSAAKQKNKEAAHENKKTNY